MHRGVGGANATLQQEKPCPALYAGHMDGGQDNIFCAWDNLSACGEIHLPPTDVSAHHQRCIRRRLGRRGSPPPFELLFSVMVIAASLDVAS